MAERIQIPVTMNGSDAEKEIQRLTQQMEQLNKVSQDISVGKNLDTGEFDKYMESFYKFQRQRSKASSQLDRASRMDRYEPKEIQSSRTGLSKAKRNREQANMDYYSATTTEGRVSANNKINNSDLVIKLHENIIKNNQIKYRDTLDQAIGDMNKQANTSYIKAIEAITKKSAWDGKIIPNPDPKGKPFSLYSNNRRNAQYYSSDLGEEQKEINNITARVSELKQERTKYRNIGDIARSTGNMTFAQSKRYAQTERNFTEGYQGVSGDSLDRAKERGYIDRFEDDIDPNSLRGRTLNTQSSIRERIEGTESELNDIYVRQEQGDIRESDTKVERELKTLLDDQYKLLQKSQQLITVLDDSFSEIDNERDRMEQHSLSGGKPIQEGLDPDSFLGRMDSRSNAMGMMMGYAMVNNIQQAMQEGKQTVDELREPSQSIGYRTGNTDFRGIRSDAGDAGESYGYLTGESLQFADTILANRGYTNDEDLAESTNNAMQFAKFSGATMDTANQFTGDLARTGASTDTVSSIQEGVLGAIQSSGMQGREEEQIAAINEVVKSISEGRDVSDEEVSSRVAMANVLSSTGNRGLQGENLAQGMQTADQAIKNADMFSATGLLLGVGSDPELMGPQGRYNFEQKIEEGLSTDNLKDIVRNSTMLGYGNSEADTERLAADIKPLLGDGFDVESIKEMIEMTRSGQFSDEELEKYARQNENLGEESLSSREQAYDESGDSTRERNDARREQMTIKTEDNALQDMFANLNSGLLNIFSANPALAMMGSMMTGVVGGGIRMGAAGSIGQVISTAMGSGIQSLSGKFGVNLGTDSNTLGGIGKGLFNNIRNKFGLGDVSSETDTFAGETASKVTEATDDVASGVSESVDDVASGVGQGATSSADDIASATASSADDIASATASSVGDVASEVTNSALNSTDDVASSLGSGVAESADDVAGAVGSSGALSGISGAISQWAGPVAAGYNAIMSLGEIAKADDKVQETGTQVGKVAGGFAGAKAGAGIGATAGTFLGGPIGTLVGTGAGALIGGIGGTFAGTKLGESVGTATSSVWDWVSGNGEDTPEEGESPETQDKTTEDIQKQADASAELNKEKLRASNIAQETENLDKWETTLNRMGELLSVAGAQNGIMGTGLLGVGGSGGGVGSGSMQTTRQSELWTNDDIGQHDLGVTSSNLNTSTLNDWIEDITPEGSQLRGQAETFQYAGQDSGLDPRFLVANAVNSMSNGNTGSLSAEQIISEARNLADNYYERGSTNLDELQSSGYSNDPNWARNIEHIMSSYGNTNQSQKPNMNNNTTINVSVEGGNNPNETGRIIATEIDNRINSIFTQEYRRV